MKRKAYLYQRFSSERQRDNSSEDRQLEFQMAWLERNSNRAELGKSFSDKALSAFKGHHLAKGELGTFLAAVEAGEIEDGSFLLVENISRLTRLNLRSSTDLIQQFWNGGITIVTVSDNMEYEPQHEDDPITMSRLFFEFDRANKEIEWHKTKISYSYKKRLNEFKKNGTIPKLRKPFWLDENGNLNEYSDAVERMFELYVEGHGQVIILRKLKEQFPDYDPIKRMNPTTIVRWITSDIAKGVWRGEKVFHAAVPESLYIAAQEAHLKKYNKHKSTNPKRSWPLSGLFRCGHCAPSKSSKEHAGMSIQQTGSSLPVLRCSYRQRKANNEAKCKVAGEPTTFPYILAHWFFISVVQEKALMKYTTNNSDTELQLEKKRLNVEIGKLQKVLDESELEFHQLVKEGKPTKFVLQLVSGVEGELDTLKQKLKEVEHQLSNLNRYLVSPEASRLISDVRKFNQVMRELGVKIYIKNKTLYYDGEKGFEYLGYNKKTDEYEYFDHLHLKRKCPIPLPHTIETLLVDNEGDIDSMLTNPETLDARALMCIF